ncbi:hypothetical protein SRS16CHR_00737 [Variovorax sp. SRS16]|nr:hypothetical protein SRS16CHR_00737 [Variovorax sp. SRS16]
MNLMRRPWLSFALPPTILVLLLWLPFGFSLHGLIEEWGVLGIFSNTGPVLFVKAHSVLEAHRLRPLTVFAHAIGFLLDRDSFDGWHWVLIATLVLKGAAASYLAAFATRSPRWGVFFGLLVLLYPADTMQLSFRSQHINLSLAALMLGAALLVRAQGQRTGWVRWISVLVGASCILAAQMMYEVALMMVVLPLFVLWCRIGTRPTWLEVRKNPAPTLAWIAAALAYVLFVLYASASGGAAYQETITDRHSPFKLLFHALPRLFDVALVRALVGGWYDAWGMGVKEFHRYGYLFAFGLICSACVVVFPRNEQTAPPADGVAGRFSERHLRLRLVISGLILLMLGYVPYLFSGSHVLISQRTFLFATFGAALVVVAVVMSLARVSKLLACAAVVFFMTAGAAAQLYQFHHYVNISEAQRKVLRAIVENFNGDMQGGKTLVILDYSNQLSHTWLLRDNLDSALTYLYDKPISLPDICLMPDGDWQRLDSIGRSGRCIEDSQNWTFKAAGPLPNTATPPAADIVRPKSRVIQIVINEDGSVVPDRALDAYREQLASADTPAARRYRNILNPVPQRVHLDLFKAVTPGASYRWDFGDWWSLEQPFRGTGWREADWSAIGYLHHDAAAWKSQEKSRLLFEILPVDKAYRLTGHFDMVRNAAIKDSISVRVNDVRVPLVWSPPYKFGAEIPEGTLRAGTNTIEFDSSVDNTFYDLSARLSEIEIRPED